MWDNDNSMKLKMITPPPKPKGDNGKNIRVKTEVWEKIRRYCFDQNITMGAFVEKTTLDKISAKIKKSSFKNS